MSSFKTRGRISSSLKFGVRRFVFVVGVFEHVWLFLHERNVGAWNGNLWVFTHEFHPAHERWHSESRILKKNPVRVLTSMRRVASSRLSPPTEANKWTNSTFLSLKTQKLRVRVILFFFYRTGPLHVKSARYRVWQLAKINQTLSPSRGSEIVFNSCRQQNGCKCAQIVFDAFYFLC